MTKPAFDSILTQIQRFAETASDANSLQEFCVSIIAERLPSYNWVGFYMLDPNDENVLVLGPFRGAPTEHVRIPVNQGICGAAVKEGETVVVADVSMDPRYLACSIETKSEIVAPIWANGKVVGEIDIDSHTIDAFGPDHRRFVEQCAALIGRLIEEKGFNSAAS